ncbi:hypothetical protein EJ04DRAFT_512029 [Polyplosphaeria fusca]|uniref:HMG box domain-containing protein n=1 Tax=Polyplosphaeria fusca TaxID=682080 RepID=A0A9P4V457_9PLEO|nr:hypothetical protein EJ04DRAFT_512029 [Polyplosphaeria fusca]
MAPTTTKAATPKAKATTTGGVRKGGPGRGAGKRANAKNAMIKMQQFFKKHRSEYKDMAFKDQQKELGKKWKTSSENPKNSAA